MRRPQARGEGAGARMASPESTNWRLGERVQKACNRLIGEFVTELPLLQQKWRFIVFGVFFQYLHGVATRTAHFLHHPGPALHDLGFALVPELSEKLFFASEVLFFAIFLPFFLWTFHPFICARKGFYTVLVWTKVLTVLVICQSLRILSFSATQLPGPAMHCREESPSSRFDVKGAWQFLALNVTKGCGDLIFSSHMTFLLVSVLTYAKHGARLVLKLLGFILVAVESILIISSRKHYTVDVVIAWYVVPLVYTFVEVRLASIVGIPLEEDRTSLDLWEKQGDVSPSAGASSKQPAPSPPFTLWCPTLRVGGLCSAPWWTTHEASLHAASRRFGGGRVYPAPMNDFLTIDLSSDSQG